MSVSLKKLWNDYGIGAIVVLLIIAYGVSLFANYLSSKGMSGSESQTGMQPQYQKNKNSQMSIISIIYKFITKMWVSIYKI